MNFGDGGLRRREDNRLGRLGARLVHYVHRYGVSVVPAEVMQLHRARSARLRRLEMLEAQMAEIELLRRKVVAELAGIDRGVEAVLADRLAELEAGHPEAWSPRPVLGYRLWAVQPDAIRGYRIVWRTPELEARCTKIPADEVPHTDGICGYPPCGIYATKSPVMLDLDAIPSSFGTAAGLVELAGKVVEHELGYRAARAKAVVLGVVYDGRMLTTADPHRIAAAFADPGEALDRWAAPAPPRPIPAIYHYLMESEKGVDPWTSASLNG